MTAPTRRPVLAALAAALVGVGLVAVPPAAAAAGDVSVRGPDPNRVDEPIGVRRVAFTITLDRAQGNTDTVTVDYMTTTDGTATPNQDYIPVNGTAVFTGNETTERVTVDVLGDALDEDDETFTLELLNYDQIVVGSATVTIEDDDGPPRVSITDAVVEEADASSVNARFTVALSSPSGRTVAVKWATADGTATAGADYTAGSDTLTFSPGQVSKVVTVAVAGDLLDEIDEDFRVELSEPADVILGRKSTGVGRILDNDSSPAVSISDATGSEGGQADFTVSLSGESGREVSVSAATAGGTATPDADYTARSESIVFKRGQTTKTFSVPLLTDDIDEPAETFQATLSGAEAAVIARAAGTGTIVDTNPGPELSIADAEVVEGDAAATMNFTVTLSGTPGQPVSVNFETADGTARAVQDYAATTGTLAFLPNLADQTRQISVPVVGDDFAELDETFTVRLTAITPEGTAQIAHGQGQATGTILDDDGFPAKVSIADAPAVTEDTDGATAVFTVTLERAVPEPAVFTYTTRDGTARAGADYEARTGTVEFAPGDTTEEIRVPIRADALDEEDTETFAVELSAPINGVIDRGTATGTITDDDAPPAVSIEGDVTLEEGNETPSPGEVVVRLAAPSGRTVTVGFTTGPEDPDDPETADATPGVDYSAESAGTLTFPPGTVRRTIPVAALPDDLDEDLEWFQATISVTEASHATLGAKPVALVAIEDGDVTPVVSITGPDPVVEPDGNSDRERVRFTITLSAVSGREVTVPVTFADGTATDPDDWRPETDNPAEVLIMPGEYGGVATVFVVGDDADESNEDFTATMGTPTNARLPEDPDARTAEAVILDSDGDPTLTVFGSTVTEGDGGTTPAPATVRLVPATDAQVTVRLSTGDDSAVAPDDYAALSEVLTFTSGQTTQTRNVAVAGDVVDEVTEAFALGLSEPTGAAVDPDGETGTVTITDDDGPSLSVNDVTVTEGTGGTTRAAFLVALSAPSPQPVSVDYATSAGTATAEEDFTSLQAQSHTFAPGETATTVEVEVIGDRLDEADEEFTLGLSNPVNATIGRGLGVATIIDDDQPTLAVAAAAGSFDTPSVAETDFGSTSLVFTLALDAPTSRESSVAYATANGRAVAGTDFLPASGRVTFAPGQTVTTVEVSVIGDSLHEADETVRLGLSDPDNLTIPGEGLGTILDDDDPGYALVASDGGIFNYGEAEFYGSTGDIPLNQPIVGIAAHPSGRGYWLVAADGGIFSFGEASFFGSTGALTLNRPIVGMAATPSGDGYWLVASDGGIFAFGDAAFFGSTGALTLNRPVVGMAATPSGDGYWLVASDGGIFAFGDAAFFGSTGAMTLNRPIVGMAPTPSGAGYWLVADDGGIFAFGDAEFLGSTGNMKLNRPVVAMAPL